MSADRTVHARTHGGGEIVRYDRAGKWYLEKITGGRIQVSLDEAVIAAVQSGAFVKLGRPGGKQFDAGVRDAIRTKAVKQRGGGCVPSSPRGEHGTQPSPRSASSEERTS